MNKLELWLLNLLGGIWQLLHWKHEFYVYHEGPDSYGAMCLGCAKRIKVWNKATLDAIFEKESQDAK